MNKHWFWLLCLPLIFLPQILSLSLFKPLVIRSSGLNSKGILSIEQVHLSWFGPQRFTKVEFINRDIDAQMDEFSSPLPLWSIKQMTSVFGIKNGNFTFPSYQNAAIEQVNGEIKGKTFSLTGITKDGSQTGLLQVTGLYEGPSNFNFQLNIEGLPVAVLDRLSEAEGKLYQVLGPNLSLKGAIAKNGPVDLTIDATYLTTHLLGTLKDDGLTLQKPLLVQWSPSFAFLATRRTAVLTLSPDGFFCPIPFSLKEAKIGSAVLDAGKILCQNQGSLRTLLGVVKFGTSSGPIEVWLTPIAFALDHQILHFERADALIARSLHICGWGDIDLAKSEYRLSLGLPADTLKQVFGIQALSQNYVIQIPVRGPLQNPNLVTGPAIAKIAALVAAGQVPKAGGILGGVIQMMSQAKTEDNAPPPKRPFPWE